jgi:hypothetical protein
MSWIFLVIENNIAKEIKIFDDYYEGADYADNFIKKIDINQDLPNYRVGEFYRNNRLTVSYCRDEKLMPMNK